MINICLTKTCIYIFQIML
uniref:Uncharacterized protein n=1 Tax=Anguilla anguilla TaxID=7936 RepID=A0A0E9R480_ANGAN